MGIKKALEILKQKGYKIEDAPIQLEDGRIFYWIDDMPKTAKEILNYLLLGEEL